MVTGGLGSLGSSLSTQPVKLGADVTIIDSNERRMAETIGISTRLREKMQVVEADIGDSASIRDVIENIDTIFNLAGDGSSIHCNRC